MVRIGNIFNFEWIVQLPEQWHIKKLMIDYSIQTISFIGLNIIYGVIEMNYEESSPVDRSTKRTLSYPTEELWHLEAKTNEYFLLNCFLMTGVFCKSMI